MRRSSQASTSISVGRPTPVNLLGTDVALYLPAKMLHGRTWSMGVMTGSKRQKNQIILVYAINRMLSCERQRNDTALQVVQWPLPSAHDRTCCYQLGLHITRMYHFSHAPRGHP